MTDLIQGQDLLLPATMINQASDAINKGNDGNKSNKKTKKEKTQKMYNDEMKDNGDEEAAYSQPSSNSNNNKKKQSLISRFFGRGNRSKDAPVNRLELVGLSGPMKERTTAGFINNDL